ncbi:MULTISPECIES: YcgN family cysteine cluster protein [unclassified Candidatus Cardinium]|uniref:YcgN family cysteine cluster protein n=1 Tax=unclassified Candidatus Cardinium TaxID=2641185 RepID=UPI001FB4BD15|nr:MULTISPECIES: YcgN family cysteine cluster protein [unclassified Candidatus Cardinium]
MDTSDEKEKFWLNTPLNEMTVSQWESLCDGCGKCCLLKIADAVSQQVRTTRICCRLLNTRTCQCSNYKERFRYVDDCIKLNPNNLKTITWLPKSCAYRLVKEKKPLPDWHPLITKDPKSTIKTGNSVKSFVVHPALVNRPIIAYLLEEPAN